MVISIKCWIKNDDIVNGDIKILFLCQISCHMEFLKNITKKTKTLQNLKSQTYLGFKILAKEKNKQNFNVA